MTSGPCPVRAEFVEALSLFTRHTLWCERQGQPFEKFRANGFLVVLR